jgi:methyl-galactoside transport system substrate-binding protein
MEVILSNNDVMAIGAIRRLRQAGYFQDLNDDGMIDRANEPWFPVVGIDGIDAAAESINAGYLYGSVRNDSATMSRAIVELMEVILGTRDGDQFGFTLDNRYVWIDYLPYTR